MRRWRARKPCCAAALPKAICWPGWWSVVMADDAIWADAAALRHRAFGRGLMSAGLGDDAMAREDRAQAIFFPALAGFRARIRDAAQLSALMAPDFRHLLDALDDHAPTQSYWDEKIAQDGR